MGTTIGGMNQVHHLLCKHRSEVQNNQKLIVTKKSVKEVYNAPLKVEKIN